MLYAFFWVSPRRLNFICRRFGTLCLFHIHRQVDEDGTECSEKSAYKIQAPGNYPEESIQQTKYISNGQIYFNTMRNEKLFYQPTDCNSTSSYRF